MSDTKNFNQRESDMQNHLLKEQRYLLEQQKELLRLQQEIMKQQAQVQIAATATEQKSAKKKSADDQESEGKSDAGSSNESKNSEEKKESRPVPKAQAKSAQGDDEQKASDDKGDAKSESADKSKKPKKKLTGKQWAIIAVIGVAFLCGASYFGYEQYTYENTDDAYVQANSTQLAPLVSGVVTHVFVDENQDVKAGQILAKINEKDYQAALASAQADFGSTQAKYQNAEDDFRRNAELLHVGSISRQDYDRSKANYESLKKQLDASASQVDQARLNLEYTSLRAPADGQIAKKSVEVGMYANSGTALMGFVPGDVRWIDANFKETQIRYMQPGRPAKVTIDAVNGKKFDAVVESIAPATGATFTLLPPDNATGNFTKVTQRLPIRLRLKNLNHDDVERLHAGLSAVVDIEKHAPLEQVPAEPQPLFLSGEITMPGPPITNPGGASQMPVQANGTQNGVLQIGGVQSATTRSVSDPTVQQTNECQTREK